MVTIKIDVERLTLSGFSVERIMSGRFCPHRSVPVPTTSRSAYAPLTCSGLVP